MKAGDRALAALLPAGTSVATTRADLPGAAPLPEEEASVMRAVAARRREFATARACARAALEPWGMSRLPIPAQPSGAPRWPDGIVGSITHCDGYRGCAVGSADDLVAIGIDAEPNEPLPVGLLDDIGNPRERAWVRDLARSEPRVCWDRLLFSAKEAVYKAWSPLAARKLGFEHAAVTVDPPSGAFAARLRGPGLRVGGRRIETLAGRWLVRDGIVLTTVALEAATTPTREVGR